MIPVRFSVFQPFEAELGTNRQSDTVNSTNSKKDINKSEETEKSKSRSESFEISSGKKTDGILFADRESAGKFIKNEKRQKSGSTKSSIVPRKSSTQSRSGRENGTEKDPKAAPKREFRRSLSSDSSVSSRPSSGGRETVAEKILRYHHGLACIVNKSMFSILTFKSVDEKKMWVMCYKIITGSDQPKTWAGALQPQTPKPVFQSQRRCPEGRSSRRQGESVPR